MRGLAKSMLTTLSTFARKPVTREYPDFHRPIPERDRAFPLLLWDFLVSAKYSNARVIDGDIKSTE